MIVVEEVRYYSLDTNSVVHELIQPLGLDFDSLGNQVPSTVQTAASINATKRLSRELFRPFQRLLLAAMYARSVVRKTF